MFLMKNGEA